MLPSKTLLIVLEQSLDVYKNESMLFKPKESPKKGSTFL